MLDDYEDRGITPAIPPCMARFCCVLNFVIPGTGTMVAGFAVFCCSKNDDMDFGDKCSSCCCSISTGILQLALTAVLLIGWCWSIVWGNYYVEMSDKYYSDPETAPHVVTTHPRNTDSNGQSGRQGRVPTAITVQPNKIPSPSPSYSPVHPPPTYTESTNIGGWQIQSDYHGNRTWRQTTENTGIGFTQSHNGSTIGGSPIEVESPPLYEVLYPSGPAR